MARIPAMMNVKRTKRQQLQRITCLLLGHRWRHFAFTMTPPSRWQIADDQQPIDIEVTTA